MSGDRADLEAAWLGLVSAPPTGPRRLWDVAMSGDPVEEWHRRRADSSPDFDADASLDRHRSAGVELTLHGDPGHPSLHAGDPHVPPVLFWRGAVGPGRPDAPTVGVIGTRRASRAGIELARELGRDLARAGCVVTSGLALGIDAAAHRGALEVDGARVLAVVGTGLDVVYPRANRSLWEAVAAQGSLVSEYPLGAAPAAWRFPARNRILVACCDAVVVVESHERGGSLITAGIAGERGVPVLAVPGSVRSPTSVGTNRLIADGCQPCLCVDDVLEAIGLSSAPSLPFPAASTRSSGGPAVRSSDGVDAATGPTAAEAEVLEALGWSARSLDEVADECPGLALGDLAVAAAGLLARGIVVEQDGRLERVR